MNFRVQHNIPMKNKLMRLLDQAGSGPYDVWVGELLYSGFAHAGIGFNWTGWLLMKLCIVLWITQYLILHQVIVSYLQKCQLYEAL